MVATALDAGLQPGSIDIFFSTKVAYVVGTH